MGVQGCDTRYYCPVLKIISKGKSYYTTVCPCLPRLPDRVISTRLLSAWQMWADQVFSSISTAGCENGKTISVWSCLLKNYTNYTIFSKTIVTEGFKQELHIA